MTTSPKGVVLRSGPAPHGEDMEVLGAEDSVGAIADDVWRDVASGCVGLYVSKRLKGDVL
jgi:hypothetical protein